ncbi:hypothetical protein PENTCL1PPCAC_18945, partial [Pristionchus entomophagus]
LFSKSFPPSEIFWIGRNMVLRLTSLLIWASLSIDGASALEGLKREVPGGGWNGIGRGFLNMFTPNKLTDEHWQIIGKMNKNFEGSLITELASSMVRKAVD